MQMAKRKKVLDEDDRDVAEVVAADDPDAPPGGKAKKDPPPVIDVEIELAPELPLLRALTHVTRGEDPHLDDLNKADSLIYFENYRAIENFLLELNSELGEPRESIQVYEGYVSRALAARFGLVPHDEDSHEFRNAVFEISNHPPSEVLEVAERIAKRRGHSSEVGALLLDIPTGLILMKLKEPGSLAPLVVKAYGSRNQERTDNE